MIYLDNSSTTEIEKKIYEAMIPFLTYEYGNPSSKYYQLSNKAKVACENAREKVARLINAEPDEIIFTSSATESNNMIIKGVSDYKKYYEKKGNHIITSKVEHMSVLNTCKFLNGEIYSNNDSTFSFNSNMIKVDRGFDVSFLDVNKFGQIELDLYDSEIKNETILSTIIWGNNEIASINDVKKLAQISHKKNVLFHTDATQVIGKMKVDVKNIGVDFLSMSGHKINAPKGIGFAYIKSDEYGLPPLSAFLHGGGQENGLRGTTLPVHDIVGLGKACEILMKNQDENIKILKSLDEIVLKEILKNDDLILLGDKDNRVFGIYNIVVNRESFNNERFIKKVSDNFAISTGSACTSTKPSHVLEAIGLNKYMTKSIRISFSINTKVNDIIEFFEYLKNIEIMKY